MHFNYIYFFRYRFIFIFLFTLVIFVSLNICYLDTYNIYEYNSKLLVNKEIWRHIYGSIGSFATPIFLYNNKYDLNSFSDLINYLSSFKILLSEFILNFNNSEFVGSFENNSELNSIYQNYMNNMVNLQNQIKNSRILIQKTNLEIHVFEDLMRNITFKYINYINSAIAVLELDPNITDPKIQKLIKELQNLVNELNKLVSK